VAEAKKTKTSPNWPLIKNTYVLGTVTSSGKIKKFTANELARKFSVSVHTIQRRMAEENWAEQRKQYMKEVEQEVAERKKKSLVDKVLEFDERVFTIACYAITILEDKMLLERVITDENGNERRESVVNKQMSAVDVKRVLEASKLAQDLRQTSLGDIRVNASEDSINKLVDLIEADRVRAVNE
jgi:hypothetical protein